MSGAAAGGVTAGGVTVRGVTAGGVTVRELHSLGEFEEVARLFDGIWRPVPGGEPVTVELMRALSHAGNYVAGAYGEDGRLIGASAGFLAAPVGEALHSHVTGALAGRGPGSRSRSTSGSGRSPAAWSGSPGPTTPWYGATPTSTWSSSAPCPRSTCRRSTGPWETRSTPGTSRTGSSRSGGWRSRA
nr:hypothetical protein GCM10020093_014030 [Planobispora longispora]